MAKTSVNIRSNFMNFLRFTLDETGAATFSQKELDTNLSAERGVMMNIHSIEVFFNNLDKFNEIAASSTETTSFQVTRESKTAIIRQDDSDLIFLADKQVVRTAAIGTDAGPLWMLYDRVYVQNFPLPIPYVKPSIFVGLQATGAAGTTVKGRIGYTLQDIDRDQFLELLVALQ